MFNILTRTNNRPKYFFLCRDSINNQDHNGVINHFVSVDDPKSMEYMEMYKNTVNVVEVQQKQRLQNNSFPYNGYLNEMLKEVKSGWVMVLDDDDKFMKNEAVSVIMDSAFEHGEDSLLLWKVKIGPRICPSVGSFGKSIRRNDVSNIGFAFHTKHREKANWPEIRGGDSKCIQTLSEHLKCVWIDDVLTCTNNNSGNFGNQRDIVLNAQETERYNTFKDTYNRHNEKLKISKYAEPEPEPEPEKEPEKEHVPSPMNKTKTEPPKREIIDVPSFGEVLENYRGERLYILKESSIKMIAEMLSNAINNKQLYEDIVNERYLINKSSSTNAGNNLPKVTTTVVTNPVGSSGPSGPAGVSGSSGSSGSKYNAKNILVQLEKDEEKRVDAMMKRSELLHAFKNVVDDDIDDNIDAIIVLLKDQISDQTAIESYLENCEIPKEKICFINCNNSVEFNSSGIIDAAKLAVKENYRRIIVINEQSLVIKTFTKELQILSKYSEYEKSDIIFCGLKTPFSRLSSMNQRVVSRARQKKKTSSPVNAEFDPDYYCMLYDDLRSSDVNTPEKAKEHWEKYGYDENRYGKRHLMPVEKSTPINEFSGVILSNNACINIAECFDETFLSIMLLKELTSSSYVVSPYLFDTTEALRTRSKNISLYNHRYIE